jgi:hypothetical protein
MKVLYCDVCKKPVANDDPMTSYFHIADIDVCEPCKDEMERSIKGIMRGKKPFDYGWYGELQLRVLRDGIQKGKIALAKR